MTDPTHTDDEDDSAEVNRKQRIEEKVRAHLEKRKDAYVKMGTVDSE